MSDPKYTTVDLDEIAGRAAHVFEYITVPDADGDRLVEQVTSVDVPALVAEVERLRGETAPRETSERHRSERDAFRDELYETRDEAERLRSEIEALRSERDAARGERDTARAELYGIEGRVAAGLAAADRDGVSLDALTVAELTAFVMGAVRRDDDPPA